MNLGALAKLAKGGADPEILKPILEAMGFKLDMQGVPLHQGPEHIRAIAGAAGKRGASLHRLSGATKGGGRLEALIVLVPDSATTNCLNVTTVTSH
jgi:hypothetical protein